MRILSQICCLCGRTATVGFTSASIEQHTIEEVLEEHGVPTGIHLNLLWSVIPEHLIVVLQNAKIEAERPEQTSIGAIVWVDKPSLGRWEATGGSLVAKIHHGQISWICSTDSGVFRLPLWKELFLFWASYNAWSNPHYQSGSTGSSPMLWGGPFSSLHWVVCLTRPYVQSSVLQGTSLQD